MKMTHKDNTIKALLKPCHRILLLHLMLEANTCLLCLPLRHTTTRATHDDVEVHTENTDVGVVTRTQIDVLLDAKAEVARLGEVLATELVLLHLQPALEDLLRLGRADGDVHGDLLVATDAELAHGVSRLGGDGCLARELLQHLRRPRQTIAGFTDGEVCAGQRRGNEKGIR